MKVETKGELRRIVNQSKERIAALENQVLSAIEENKTIKSRLLISFIVNLFLILLLALRFGVVSL